MDRPPQHAFSYSELAKPTNFRIFQLSLESGDITGTLEEHDLDDPPEYECVSYVWGKGPKDHQVTIDDGFIWITETLVTALLSFVRGADSMERRTRALWVDQITINRDDMNEKSQQVQRMGQVYKKARRNVLWTGLVTPKSQVALTLILQVLEGWPSDSSADSDLYGPAADVFWKSTSVVHPPSAEELDALEEMFNRWPIWHRVWIVQEIVLPRDIVLLHGKAEIISLPHLIWVIIKVIGAQTVPYRSFASFVNLHLLRHNVESQDWVRLEHVLARLEGWEATDPRDLVYGFLGLVQNPGIIPDYTKTVSQPKAKSMLGDWPTSLAAGTGTSDALSISVSGTTLTAAGRHIDSIAFIFDDGEQKADIVEPTEAALHLARILGRLPPYLLNTSRDASLPIQMDRYDPIWQTFMFGTHVLYNDMSPEKKAELRLEFFKFCLAIPDLIGGRETRPDDLSFSAQWWMEAVHYRQKFALTKTYGCFVAVNQVAQVGDEICVLSTAKVPFVVRKKTPEDETSEEYIRLGTAYVHNVMYGEAWSQDDKYPPRTYKLV